MAAGGNSRPVGIAGSEEILRSHGRHFPKFGRVAVVVGPAIQPPHRSTTAVPRAEVDALTAELAERLQVVFDEAYALRNRG